MMGSTEKLSYREISLCSSQNLFVFGTWIGYIGPLKLYVLNTFFVCNLFVEKSSVSVFKICWSNFYNGLWSGRGRGLLCLGSYFTSVSSISWRNICFSFLFSIFSQSRYPKLYCSTHKLWNKNISRIENAVPVTLNLKVTK